MTYETAAKLEAPFVPAIARRKLPVNGWVYFILGADSGRFKIGRALDVEKRIKAMQTGCSETLSVYGVLPAVSPAALERALHKRFASCRVQGEWFSGAEEIAEFVDMYGYECGGTHRIWEELYPDELPAPRLAPAYRL